MAVLFPKAKYHCFNLFIKTVTGDIEHLAPGKGELSFIESSRLLRLLKKKKKKMVHRKKGNGVRKEGYRAVFQWCFQSVLIDQYKNETVKCQQVLIDLQERRLVLFISF